MKVSEFQKTIEDIYLVKDSSRGVSGTFVWFVEEVGELARAIKGSDRDNLEEEFADVFAWLSTLASMTGVDLAEAASKYAKGCPKCHATPCHCHEDNRLVQENRESPKIS
ncbi:MAG: NTP pyrophosphatase (non-canonical NTP hydrolase) [Planctomycetota bacterium]|jgi:NTP pyrophosphatase (non-canonical NTP hydrolase)